MFPRNILSYDNFISKINEMQPEHKDITVKHILGGALMFRIDVLNWLDILNLIDIEDVVKFEYNPHITIAYGFPNTTSQIHIQNKLIYSADSILKEIELVDLSIFENELDILKISIQSDKINYLNSIFHKSNKGFNPHITIGYLHKGCANKYLYLENYILNNIVMSNPYFIYSNGINNNSIVLA